MKLAVFEDAINDKSIVVNVDHVVYFRELGREGRVTVVLATGKELSVKGTLMEVAGKLEG